MYSIVPSAGLIFRTRDESGNRYKEGNGGYRATMSLGHYLGGYQVSGEQGYSIGGYRRYFPGTIPDGTG